MFEIITIIVFVWLLAKAIGLAFKLTWGTAKVIASILMVLATPLLFICVLFAGGLILLVPITIISIAVVILKACV